MNANGLTGSAVEIGVAFGGYATTVLASWQGREYYLVDPWEQQPKEIYKERTEGVQYNSWHEQCRALAARDPRVIILREYSARAADQLPDNYFDSVYIDGNHCREAFSLDLEKWWPKVKSGGLFGGHDCYDATTDGHYCEVATVLKEWSEARNLTPTLTPCSSWWIVKP